MCALHINSSIRPLYALDALRLLDSIAEAKFLAVATVASLLSDRSTRDLRRLHLTRPVHCHCGKPSQPSFDAPRIYIVRFISVLAGYVGVYWAFALSGISY